MDLEIAQVILTRTWPICLCDTYKALEGLRFCLGEPQVKHGQLEQASLHVCVCHVFSAETGKGQSCKGLECRVLHSLKMYQCLLLGFYLHSFQVELLEF